MTDPIAYVESQLQSIQKRMEGLHADIARLVKERDAMHEALKVVATAAESAPLGDSQRTAALFRSVIPTVAAAIALYGSTV